MNENILSNVWIDIGPSTKDRKYTIGVKGDEIAVFEKKEPISLYQNCKTMDEAKNVIQFLDNFSE